MNNTFRHAKYEIEYLIPYARQLTPSEAARVVDHVIAREKEALFESFKATTEGKAWSGDENKKKEELFVHAHRFKAPVFVFGEPLDDLVDSGAKKG